MNVLLTGANGLLGQKLIQLFLQKNTHQLLTTSSSSVKKFDFDVEYIQMDICDVNKTTQIFNDFNPDVVIHTAAVTNVDECQLNQKKCRLINVNAVKTLIKLCEKHNSFLLHLSTDFIFDGSTNNLSETNTANPVNYYGKTKFKAEQLIINSKLKWSIVRTALLYGIVKNMSKSNIILWVKDNLSKNKKIRVVTDQLRTPTLVEDLAIGCYEIINNLHEGIFNIAGKDFLSPYQMAVHTADFFELDKSLIEQVDSNTFKQSATRPLLTGFIIEKAKQTFNYSPRSFDEGIQILAQQIKQNEV